MLCTLARPDRRARARSPATTSCAERDEVRRNIGLVFQDTTLDGYLTAEQNLRFHAELYGVPRDAVRGRACARCSRWSGCGSAATSRVQTFSGGMKRRLEIARGLLHSPRVLFLDEPTVGLDPQTRALDLGATSASSSEREDITIFLTTHYMDEAEHCDRIAIMDHGEIVVARHARGAEGERRQGPGADPHRRRRGGDRRAARALRPRGGDRTRAR